MRELVYRVEAVSDIRAAFDWYEGQRRGLGDEFLEELQKAERSVRASPTAFRVAHRNAHRYLMPRFPYQVLYRVVDEVIVVIGCFHVRRAPKVAREPQIVNCECERQLVTLMTTDSQFRCTVPRMNPKQSRG